MPIFDYQCQERSCLEAHNTIEKIVDSSEDVVECVGCGLPMARLLSAPGGIYGDFGTPNPHRNRRPKTS